MTEHKSSKKITRAEGGSTPGAGNEAQTFVPTAENKSKATTFRLIAIISWVLAIGAEVFGIMQLQKDPVNMTWLIVAIVVALVFAVVGSVLWKKSNRLDPASKKEKVKFFIQNQLGAIISVIAFLPLIILIFTNKNMDGKQKGLAGTIAIAALVIAGLVGVDFNPPSVEEYTEQTERVKELNDGNNLVYWTKSGRSYHIFQTCSYINTDRTTEIFEGSVAQARELKNITDLCDRCERQAVKEKGLEEPVAAPEDSAAEEEETNGE